MIDSEKLKKLYLEFYKKKDHAVIPNAPLIPENDPTVLFTTAGMHPLVPFLLGEKHPLGKRLVNFQKCLRTDDIEEVGDNRHLSLFEMLGNWSLGDYFKKEALEWSWEFITDSKTGLGIDPKRLYVSVFKGDDDIPRDDESVNRWKEIFKDSGIDPKVDAPLSEGGRIFLYERKKCFWGPVGQTGPCGPNSEMFYDTLAQHNPKYGEVCHPNCDCGKFVELGNNVFMEYCKDKDGKYNLQSQKNVDVGLGLDRIVKTLQKKDNVFEIETLAPLIEEISGYVKVSNIGESQKISMRIVADHVRTSTFILAEKVVPKNVEQGYILRRLIRRAIRHGRLLGIEDDFLSEIAKVVIDINKKDYPYLLSNKEFILEELKKEEIKFGNTIAKGLRKFTEISKEKHGIDAKDAFLLFQSFGFPIEMTKELGNEMNISVDEKGFAEEFKKHQELSREGAEKKFKGGLTDITDKTVKLHTATHMLNEALRIVLKRKDIFQKGSNITPDRLRFDFNFDRKLTDEELGLVEDAINKQIEKGLPIKREEMTVDEAKRKGAQAVFEDKYGERVSVYSIGDFSVEICGGPHVDNTKQLGKFKIIKEEGVAAGVRRIKACLE
jgi:alanyl-tRNA synthetase